MHRLQGDETKPFASRYTAASQAADAARGHFLDAADEAKDYSPVDAAEARKLASYANTMHDVTLGAAENSRERQLERDAEHAQHEETPEAYRIEAVEHRNAMSDETDPKRTAELEKLAEKAEQKAYALDPAPTRGSVSPDHYGMQTQSGQPVTIEHFQDKQGLLAGRGSSAGGDWPALSRQDHADMVVGLEHNIEKLYEEADHLDTIGLDSTETRDEIKEHESARDAHKEAAFGPAKEEPSTQTAIDFTKPPKQHDPTAAVAAQIEPTHALAAFAAKPTSTAPIKNVGGMVGAQKFQPIAGGKGRGEETKSLQTGAKGGRFYISASGAKIYAKGM